VLIFTANQWQLPLAERRLGWSSPLAITSCFCRISDPVITKLNGYWPTNRMPSAHQNSTKHECVRCFVWAIILKHY
jgi:hypothetical protein